MSPDLIRTERKWVKSLTIEELLGEYQSNLRRIVEIAQRLQTVGPIPLKIVDDYGPHYMRNQAIMVQLIKNEIIIR